MSGIEILILICFVAYIAFEIYCYKYFNSDQFKNLKNNINKHVNNCNDLNHHIEELKSSYVHIKSYDYGHGELRDNSNYNFKRGEWKNFTKSSRVHNCSASVLNNVRNQPIKYLCKYFDIKTTEDTLTNIEDVLNAFSAAEQGKMLLAKERDSIVGSIRDSVPNLIYSLSKNRLIKKLGFETVDLSDLYFPVYKFQYVSSGGNSSAAYEIKLNIQNLENLVNYLGDLVKFRKSVQGQRALMTTRLREQIKSRDNFSCQICKISVNDEANLLLEIDHIIPISKGGITSIENLQTLCWKCNRSKGAKI
nr:HNH endonuclease signature motif containing protein [uncultured Undibacterium sp.]